MLNPRGEFVDYVLTWEDGVADPQAMAIDKHGYLVLTEPSAGQYLLSLINNITGNPETRP